ncbi:MAG: JAB domain-containing protein [Cyclobacteriaceae bacterium]
MSYSRKVKDCDRFKITDSESAVAVLRSRWKKGRIQYVEEFKTIFLDRSNRVLGLRTVSQGGQAGCVADPKVIFGAALKAHAAALIAAHNHPSGQLSPSEADIKLTRKLKEIGILLDLPLLDHIILTQDSYRSFADEGML